MLFVEFALALNFGIDICAVIFGGREFSNGTYYATLHPLLSEFIPEQCAGSAHWSRIQG